jgi:hypothetical protein
MKETELQEILEAAIDLVEKLQEAKRETGKNSQRGLYIDLCTKRAYAIYVATRGDSPSQP